MDEARVRQLIDERFSALLGGDRFIFQKHLQLFDGRHIQLGRETGTKIGTNTDQKLAFFGTTPVVQQAAPTDTASIIALLQAYGLSA